MKERFESAFGRRVNISEYNSWNNSCQHVKNVIETAGLTDNMLCLEYEVPYNTGRIDCMLFGCSENGKSHAVLMELKQWSFVDEVDDEDNVIETFVAGRNRKVPHPSQQIEGYHHHLVSFVTIFETEEDFDLYSCAYCHNYAKDPGRGLFAERFNALVDKFPVFTKDDVLSLANKLKFLLGKGNGFEIFNRFMQSPVRPSQKLLEEASKIVNENKAVFSLLNEQLVAKNVIMSKVRQAKKKGLKSVVVVHGGPGTGKTVIALNVLADLARKNKSVFYGCKSKPFRAALEKIVGPKSRILFSNLSRFLPSKIEEGSIDVVLIDEAHRIAKKSNSQYTKREDRTDMPQIDQVIRSSKTAVFFIDDNQVVRSQEVGSSDLIKDAAERFEAIYEDIQLVSQFRCAGSDNYLDWLEYVLGYKEKPIDLPKEERFEFKIFDDPNELYEVIKNHESKKANSARLVAGYCWPWSKTLNPDGTLIKDVVILEHNFAMPWEAQDKYPGKIAKGIPKWFQWAYQTGGVNQVGCIYTAQGFEFDYIGVIIGPDLKYDKQNDCLSFDVGATCDPTLRKDIKNFDTYAKNIYRVLMTRGMKGCYVYFCDKEVENYFKKHIKGDPYYQKPLMVSDIVPEDEQILISVESEIEEHLKYTESLPVYTMEAACGAFGEGKLVEKEGWIKADRTGLHRNMFVVRASGKSMEPRIKDGDHCIFKFPVVGSRQNKIVLVQHLSTTDETGCRYSIKKYTSKKTFNADGTWQHEQIVLNPLNAKFDPIVIDNAEDGEFMVVAEFVDVII
ncbi:MAG: DUF2075 domain-containing protein [Candidatus Omnitrophica bacterium]|nr:DUF2075 domain-containing protein [Candidatus Omnitrophota bacterium]